MRVFAVLFLSYILSAQAMLGGFQKARMLGLDLALGQSICSTGTDKSPLPMQSLHECECIVCVVSMPVLPPEKAIHSQPLFDVILTNEKKPTHQLFILVRAELFSIEPRAPTFL